MNTDYSVTKQRIVEASVHLFSSQGFNGTSTREIARLADVNETSLFRYFPRKQDLFWVALQSRLDKLRIRKDLLTRLAQVDDPRVVLPLIIEFLVNVATYQPELLKLLGVSLLEMRPGGELVWREQLGPIFQSFVRYIEDCVSKGSIRKLDAWATTISFLTAILAHETMYRLLTGAPALYATAADAAAAHSSYWLGVLLPTGTSTAERAGHIEFERSH